MTDDIYIRYLRQYYAEHGTINDIPFKFAPEFEGKKIYVYDFLKNIRNRHRAYIGEGKPMSGYKSATSIRRYQALDEMNYDWNGNSRKTKETVQNEPEVRFLRSHFEEFGTINDIPYGTEVEFEGKTLKIGSFLKILRERHVYFVKGENTRYATSEIFVERYKILDEMNFDWEPNKRIPQKQAQNEICLKYLREYFKANGTIDDITSKDVVQYDNQTIEIGRFLETTRANYRKYIAGNTTDSCASSVMLERYEELNKMNFIWEPQAYKSDIKGEKDPYIQYLRYYYAKYGTINDIKADFVTTFRGQTLNIGDFLSKIRYNYNQYQNGNTKRNYGSKLSLQRYQILSEMGFNFTVEKKPSLREIAEENGLSLPSLSKLYRKFDGNIDKALKIALLKEKKVKKKDDEEKANTIDHLLETFDIDFESLIIYLNRTSHSQKKKIEEVLRYDNMTLKEFCTRNGYNYEVLARAIRLKKNAASEESFESLVNRSIIELNSSGQKRPSNWIYAKYGNEVLVKHMLLFIGFNSTSILSDMSKNIISLEEAFMNESFKRYSKNSYRYLEGIYLDYIQFYHELSNSNCTDALFKEKMVTKASELISYYCLTQEEFTVIREAFFCYTNAVHKFHLCDVGFEKDDQKRVEKIISYKLDSDDIEEAFFIPLKFDGKVLIGRDSQLYQRRSLLKNLTVSWNDLTEEDKASKINDHNLTSEEVFYINNTRKTIDKVKTMVLTHK